MIREEKLEEAMGVVVRVINETDLNCGEQLVLCAGMVLGVGGPGADEEKANALSLKILDLDPNVNGSTLAAAMAEVLFSMGRIVSRVEDQDARGATIQ